MNLVSFPTLIILQFITGFGILNLFRIDLKPLMFISLAVLLGVANFSIIPFLLQLFFIPLTSLNVFLGVVISAILFNLKPRNGLQRFRNSFRSHPFRIRIYELFSIGLIALIVFVSVWRCFYFPPTPRDFTSGAEVIAEYATREKTMINSVFTVNLESTNNPFKSPSLISLQIIYKYAGFPFGQVWLCGVFVFFIIFLYQALSASVHKLITGILIIMFLAIPEMYAYTFMVLFDYTNAVFFFLSLYFLFEFFRSSKNNVLLFAGLLMGISVYFRSETLILAGLVTLLLCWHHIKKWDSGTRLIISNMYFLLPSVLFYLVSVTIYLNFYLPVKYEVGDLINKNLFDITALWDRFYQMNERLIFSEQGVGYYGYFIFIFLLFLIVEIVFMDRWRKEPKTWLYGVMVIYFGYPFLGYLLPLLDIDHSTKRGLFKMFPLMLMHMGNSGLLKVLSEKITNWENSNSRRENHV
jgi:hypothetical protein